jgi:DNA-directed RNA polymerase specialized sigma24 family protein
MTFQEIADITGESINTVASRYRYGIDKLRTSLA